MNQEQQDLREKIEREYPFEIYCRRHKKVIGYTKKLPRSGEVALAADAIRVDGTMPVKGTPICDEPGPHSMRDFQIQQA